MDMAIEPFTEYIRRAVGQTQFRNVWGNRFDSSVMHELYARKRRREYCLSNTEAISVRETELADIVSELTPMVARYSSHETGAVGNGLYKLMGSWASPRLPSVQDYAKILILAAARLGPERVAGLFAGWVDGRPVRVWLCALLKGAITDGRLSPIDGLFLETLPRNGDEFPRSLYVQIDEHDTRHEQYAQRVMLSLEHEVGPALYSPDGDTDSRFPQPLLRPTIRNPELSSVSPGSLCRAMSVEINGYVDWFRQWWDYGDVDAFFLHPVFSSDSRDISNPPPILVSEEQLRRCLKVHGLLEKYTRLDLCIARWLRSKRATVKEEQLIELRIALESVLLGDDKGVVGEKRHRLSVRGAWLLGETFDQRKTYFRMLREAYGSASSVLHAGSLEKKDTEALARVIGEAQDRCREAILRIANAKGMPDWSDVVLGKGFHRGREGDAN